MRLSRNDIMPFINFMPNSIKLIDILWFLSGVKDVLWVCLDTDSYDLGKLKYLSSKFGFYFFLSKTNPFLVKGNIRNLVISKSNNLNVEILLNKNSNSVQIGRILGYPMCCSVSFEEYFRKRKNRNFNLNDFFLFF